MRRWIYLLPALVVGVLIGGYAIAQGPPPGAGAWWPDTRVWMEVFGKSLSQAQSDGDLTGTPGADSISNTQLDLIDAGTPTDGYCLTYDSDGPGGDLNWEECGSGGATHREADDCNTTESGGVAGEVCIQPTGELFACITANAPCGAGQWTAVGGGTTEVSDDATPVLGGNLSLGGFNIGTSSEAELDILTGGIDPATEITGNQVYIEDTAGASTAGGTQSTGITVTYNAGTNAVDFTVEATQAELDAKAATAHVHEGANASGPSVDEISLLGIADFAAAEIQGSGERLLTSTETDCDGSLLTVNAAGDIVCTPSGGVDEDGQWNWTNFHTFAPPNPDVADAAIEIQNDGCIQFEDDGGVSSNIGRLCTGTLTGTQVWTLPDVPGEIAMATDIQEPFNPQTLAKGDHPTMESDDYAWSGNHSHTQDVVIDDDVTDSPKAIWRDANNREFSIRMDDTAGNPYLEVDETTTPAVTLKNVGSGDLNLALAGGNILLQNEAQIIGTASQDTLIDMSRATSMIALPEDADCAANRTTECDQTGEEGKICVSKDNAAHSVLMVCEDIGGGLGAWKVVGGPGASSTTELLYNNAGTVDGASGFTTDGSIITIGSAANIATSGDPGDTFGTVTGSGIKPARIASVIADVYIETGISPALENKWKFSNAGLMTFEGNADLDANNQLDRDDLDETNLSVETHASDCTLNSCGAGEDGRICFDDVLEVVFVCEEGSGWKNTGSATSSDIDDVGDCSSGACFTAAGTGNSLYFEGVATDAFEGVLTSAAATSTKTWTLPNVTGDVTVLGQVIDLAADVGATVLPNANGGTGADSSAFTGIARVDSGTWTAAELSGDVVTSGSNATIQAGAVDLGAMTTGNYVDDVIAGAGISVSHTPGEGSDATIATDSTKAGFLSTVLNVSCISEQGVVSIPSGNPLSWCDGADVKKNAAFANNSGDALTVDDAVAGNGLAAATGVLSIDLGTADGTGDGSSASGLELNATTGELALLQGCGVDAILKWNDVGNAWECQADEDAGGTMSTFTLAGSTGSGTIVEGETLTIASGLDITTAWTATDTITVALDGSLSNTVEAVTAAPDTDSALVATTAFVQQEINNADGTNLTCASGTCDVTDAWMDGISDTACLTSPTTKMPTDGDICYDSSGDEGGQFMFRTPGLVWGYQPINTAYFTEIMDLSGAGDSGYQIKGAIDLTTDVVVTLPPDDAAMTLVSADGVQTLTNKTLTSPAINGATIDATSTFPDFVVQQSATVQSGAPVDGTDDCTNYGEKYVREIETIPSICATGQASSCQGTAETSATNLLIDANILDGKDFDDEPITYYVEMLTGATAGEIVTITDHNTTTGTLTVSPSFSEDPVGDTFKIVDRVRLTYTCQNEVLDTWTLDGLSVVGEFGSRDLAALDGYMTFDGELTAGPFAGATVNFPRYGKLFAERMYLHELECMIADDQLDAGGDSVSYRVDVSDQPDANGKMVGMSTTFTTLGSSVTFTDTEDEASRYLMKAALLDAVTPTTRGLWAIYQDTTQHAGQMEVFCSVSGVFIK